MPEQLKVLVVDDEESVVVTIKAILQLDGYNVATTTSGVQARAMVRDVEYDLVLTDLRLEDGDGLDVLKAVRENHPDTITSPARKCPSTTAPATSAGTPDTSRGTRSGASAATISATGG